MKPLRILHLEDSLADFELVKAELERDGLVVELTRVGTREAFLDALGRLELDLIIADYTLPQFDGIEALKLSTDSRPDIPFILVSGSIGEERAIEVMALGAADYVLKDKIARLAPAVRRAIEKVQHRKERAALEEQVRRADRLESLGKLAGGIAHDFNNVLSGIVGYTRIAMKELPDGASHESLNEVLRASERAKELVGQILAFSRHRPPEDVRKPERLEAIGRETLKLVRPTAPKSVALELEAAPDLPLVSANAPQMGQVLLNLCVNAIHAMPGGGTLRIKFEKVILGEADCERFLDAEGSPTLRPGPHLKILVSDTGTGIAPADLKRIFEPFFTTKGGQGTGMGLAVVYGIVKEHGGEIQARSSLGQGTVFEILLPVARTTEAVPSQIKSG